MNRTLILKKKCWLSCLWTMYCPSFMAYILIACDKYFAMIILIFINFNSYKEDEVWMQMTPVLYWITGETGFTYKLFPQKLAFSSRINPFEQRAPSPMTENFEWLFHCQLLWWLFFLPLLLRCCTENKVLKFDRKSGRNSAEIPLYNYHRSIVSWVRKGLEMNVCTVSTYFFNI